MASLDRRRLTIRSMSAIDAGLRPGGALMLRSRSPLCACVAVLAAGAGVGCSSQTGVATTPPDTRVADEAAIRAKDDTFEQGVAAKDAEKILALYEDGAVLFAPKAPAAIGKDAI